MIIDRYVSGFVSNIGKANLPGGNIIQSIIIIKARPMNKSSISNLVTAPSIIPLSAIKPRKKQIAAWNLCCILSSMNK